MTETESESERRQFSKLEKDDPEHCKKCGAELEEGFYGATDDQGRPERLVYGSFESIEKCGDCWVDSELAEVLSEFRERYPEQEYPEVLDR